jgi:hypothetical protein
VEDRFMIRARITFGVAALSAALVFSAPSDATAQLQPPQVKGLRGAPQFPGPDVPALGAGAAWDAKPPEGVQPLPRDLFTSKDFYKDKDLWMDQRYWRCNSARQVADMRSGGAGSSTDDPRIGASPPGSARWGDCKVDWARENMVSPYPFKTAKEHYEALMADAKRRGGPTKHTYETMPKWDGAYGEYTPMGRRVWNYMRASQVPTILSLLTPTYQQRMVQQLYHEGVNSAHAWSQSYCWPEGYMRQWATGYKWSRVLMTPEIVLLIGNGMNRPVHLNRQFPLGDSIRQWYGDTIGFWDGDALITWTANVQGWNQHTAWEWSDSLEAIEVFTPTRDAGGKFLGVDQELIVYDPEALVQPVRILWHRNYQRTWTDAGRLGFGLCTRPMYPIDGIPTAVAPGQVIPYQVPDMLDRPWAEIWKVLEKDMARPIEALDLGFK